MSRNLTKAQLCTALTDAGMEYPPSATIAQLRLLCDDLGVGAPVDALDDQHDLPVENPPENVPNEVMIDDDEQMLIRLRRRRELLALQREIQQMEEEVVRAAPRRRAEFADVEHSLSPFSGDDSYGVRKWLADFEEVLSTLECDDNFRLRCLRRLLCGTAKTFLRTVHCDNYAALRNSLLAEFEMQLTRPQIFAKLACRRIRQNETAHQFVLNMQELASHANIEEIELIDFIITGLHDPVGATVFYNARTIAEMKHLLPRYEQRRRSAETTAAVKQKQNAKQSGDNAVATKSTEQFKRCFNCAGFGHLSTQCPKPKKQQGACFECKEYGHTYTDCPKRTKTTAAMVDESQSVVENLADTLAATELVSVAFLLGANKHTRFLNLTAIFDTGSPTSFVRRSSLPDSVRCSDELYDSHLRGLGSLKLYTYGKLQCVLNIRNRVRNICLLILPDEVLPTPLLLGRDCLNYFGIHLRFGAATDTLSVKTLNKDNLFITYVTDESFVFDFPEVVCKTEPIICAAVAAPLCVAGSIAETPCDKILSMAKWPSTVSREKGSLCAELVPDIFAIDFVEPKYSIGNASLTLQIECEKLIDRVYAECLSRSKFDIVTPSVHEMQIRLTSDVPFYCPPRRLSVYEKNEVQKIISGLLDDGVIRPSDSPYASPIVLVKKKNGETRLCVDYRSLNKLTVRDNFPIPLIEDCLEYLDGKRWFTVLDLKSGFHQVQVSPESIKLTSFVTPTGQYEYVRMPFGLKNAPAVFQRFITAIFRDFLIKNEIVIYLDDILLATPDESSHLLLLERILCRLRKYNLQLRMSKCKFLHSEIDYLGYTVNAKGIRPNDAHIRAITEYPMPKNVKQLQSCLGLFQYFRRFVSSFSRIAKPLCDLLKSDSVFEFDEACVHAFHTLRDALISAPILALYNPKRDTELHTDASASGFGAVLLQKQDDGRLHPVSFFSKRTTGPESRYHSFELETLAIIYALRRFRVYLEGIPFRIVTDCNSLTLTLSKRTVNHRIYRWALELENYNYTIHHRIGSSMGHVDALSRCDIVCFLRAQDVDFQLQATQARDPIIVELRSSLENCEQERFELRDGLVYRRFSHDRVGLYVPVEMESNVIRFSHEEIGHLGADKCFDQIRRHYWFPGMRLKIEKFIKNCIQCIMCSSPVRLNRKNLHSIPKIPVPFHTIHIDHYGPLPSIQSKRKYILVVVDAFTKFVKLYPVNSTSTREVICSLQKYFDYYSRPRRIISDRGTCFTSLEFSEFLLRNQVEHVKVATASPQANGQVERVNRVLTPMISKSVEPVRQSDWPQLLTRVEFALNNTVHSTTKHTPSELLFGVLQRGPTVDPLTEHLEEKLISTKARCLDEIRDSAAKSIAESQAKNERHFESKNKQPIVYSEGDFVVMRNVDTSIGSNKKFIPKFRGPYVVHKVLPHDRYVLRDIENCQLTQLPYDGVVEAARLRLWKDEREKLVSMCR